MTGTWIKIEDEKPSIDGFYKMVYLERKEGLVKPLYDGRYINAEGKEIEPLEWLKFACNKT